MEAPTLDGTPSLADWGALCALVIAVSLGTTIVERAEPPADESPRPEPGAQRATAWIVIAAATATGVAAYISERHLLNAMWWMALAAPAAVVVSWPVGITLLALPALRRARGRLTPENRRRVAGVVLLWVLAVAIIPVGITATVASGVDPRTLIPLTLLASYAAMWAVLARARRLRARTR